MQGIRSYLFHTFADKYAGNSDYFIWKKEPDTWYCCWSQWCGDNIMVMVMMIVMMIMMPAERRLEDGVRATPSSGMQYLHLKLHLMLIIMMMIIVVTTDSRYNVGWACKISNLSFFQPSPNMARCSHLTTVFWCYHLRFLSISLQGQNTSRKEKSSRLIIGLLPEWKSFDILQPKRWRLKAIYLSLVGKVLP